VVDYGRRYDDLHGDDNLSVYVSKAQFEVDGDSEAYFHRLGSEKNNLISDPNGVSRVSRDRKTP
jgi:hypothetical protein